MKNVQREWDTHKEQCCSGTENARLSKVTERMALEMLLFCDMRKAQKDNYCMISIIWGNGKTNLIGTESEMVVARSWREWKSGWIARG